MQGRGRFITVEGGEGAGKSTQIARMIARLRAAGLEPLATREPGGTALAEEIRALILAPREERVEPVTELLLIFAARAQHVRGVILPALQAGRWVVCDRFSDATLAYQGSGRGMDDATIRSVDAIARAGLAPDLTLLLDVPVERGLARASARGAHDRFEQERVDFHERVRGAYLAIARAEPERVRVIDAARPEQAVAADVEAALDGFLAREHARG
jgi:dTMP kinase